MNVGVIGLGLIGGSIALKIKEIDTNTVIYGLDKEEIVAILADANAVDI